MCSRGVQINFLKAVALERVLSYEQVVGGRAWTWGEGPPKHAKIICFRYRVLGSGDKLNQAQTRGKEDYLLSA